MDTKSYTTAKPYKIIVVTNDNNFLEILKNMFDYHYQFHQSQPVDNIVKKACKLQPDLILKDITKGRQKSFQIFKSLKNDFRTRHIPIITITQNEKPGNIEKFIDAGVSGNITKQFSAAEIRSIIKTHLELKRKTDENKEMDLIKTRVFSIMTNEIKNSLIGVRGIAGFLLKDLEDNIENNNESIKMARILYDDSKELYNFLENLIEWASIETNKIEVKPVKVRFHDTLNSTLEHFRNHVNRKNINIVCRYDENIRLTTDKKALNTILFHLISNAIKYSNKNGKIVIRAETSDNGSTTLFMIEDNGTGMDNSIVKHLFNLDTPHPKSIGTNGEKGTGLGLIICRSMVEKILGKIDIESSKHRGTKVTVKLPELKNAG